jgi:hypothetical protein
VSSLAFYVVVTIFNSRLTIQSKAIETLSGTAGESSASTDLNPTVHSRRLISTTRTSLSLAWRLFFFLPAFFVFNNQQSSFIMGNMFGKEKPLKEVLRENKRTINRAVRELDREKMTLEREEKRLIMDIKKAAKDQQMAAVKIMAKVTCRVVSIHLI